MVTQSVNQTKNTKKNNPEINIDDENIDQVVCDGGGGPLGHPQVWYSFDTKKEVNCHYCGRKFVRK